MSCLVHYRFCSALVIRSQRRIATGKIHGLVSWVCRAKHQTAVTLPHGQNWTKMRNRVVMANETRNPNFVKQIYISPIRPFHRPSCRRFIRTICSAIAVQRPPLDIADRFNPGLRRCGKTSNSQWLTLSRIENFTESRESRQHENCSSPRTS